MARAQRNQRSSRKTSAEMASTRAASGRVSKSSAEQPPSTKRSSRKAEAAEMWSRWSADTQSAGDYYTLEMKRALADNDATRPSVANEPSSDEGRKQDERDVAAIRTRIAKDSTLTPFRRHVLTLLCQVPRGQFTTYKALSDAVPLTAASHNVSRDTSVSSKSGCARAVGLVMRTNPYAPVAPCHRVLTADGKIGGYKGTSGDEGRFVQEKRRLLKEEGVQFDGKGNVVGMPFTGFV